MAARKLFIDRQNQTLVIFPGEGGITSLPAMFQGNTQQLEITLLDPTGNQTAPYSKVDLAGASLRVSIGQTPTGSAGGPTPLAIQTTWAWNATNKKFVGSIALNTAEIDAFIGAASSAQAFFEVNIVESGNRETVYQTTFNLKAVVDEATSFSPAPTDTYLTKPESDQRYVKRMGEPGEAIVLTSPSNLYQVTLYVDDNGNLVTASNPV